MLARRHLVTLALAGGLTLTGCGSSGAGGAGRLVAPSGAATSASPTTVLTKAQAADAVISLADLGSGFKVDHDNSDGSADLGCLDDVDKLLKQAGTSKLDNAVAKHEAQYAAATEIGMPFVMSSVDSLRSTSEIQRGLSLVEKALRTCRTVDTTDADGTHLQLDITTDRKADRGADDQVNLTATGQMSLQVPTGQTITVPFYLRISISQVGNNLAMIGYGSMVSSAEGDDDSAALTGFGIARLKAVASGTPVPTAPDFGLRKITTDDILKAMSGGNSEA